MVPQLVDQVPVHPVGAEAQLSEKLAWFDKVSLGVNTWRRTQKEPDLPTGHEVFTDCEPALEK
jgi:hypothetical protein